MNPKVNYGLWMVIRCQCKFMNCKKHPTLMKHVVSGEVMHVGGCEFTEKSLYLPLNFVINLKLL